MKRYRNIWTPLLLALLVNSQAAAQDTGRYLMGEEKNLQIMVYILGEVDKPGEYFVSDNTDVVELISKAGGATEYSNLGTVSIARTRKHYPADSPVARLEKHIIRYNVGDYLNNPSSLPPPMLQPGDVVYVRRNKWSKWRSAFTVIRDLSVVASAYFLYQRSNN